MKVLCVVILSLTLSQLSQAEPYVGVKARSFGGADRAMASSNDIIFYNPAGMIKKRRFSTELDYLWEARDKAHRAGASLLDSQTGAWALGLAYSGRFVQDKKIPNSHLLYLSAAMPLGTDIFSVGLSFHYLHDRGLGPEPIANFFNIDAGILINLPVGLSIGAVVNNLIKPKGREKDLGFALATAFDIGVLLPALPLALSFDWLMDDVKSKSDLHHVLMAGAQYTIIGIVPIKLGYHGDLSSRKKLISVGAGIKSGFFSADALYQQNLKLGEDRYLGLAFGFSF